MKPSPACGPRREPDPAAAPAWDALDQDALLTGVLGSLSPATEPPIAFGLPPVASPGDIVEAGSALIASVSAGDIAARDAMPMMRLLTVQMRLLAAERRAGRGAGR